MTTNKSEICLFRGLGQWILTGILLLSAAACQKLPENHSAPEPDVPTAAAVPNAETPEIGSTARIYDPLMPPERIGEASADEVKILRDTFNRFKKSVLNYQGKEAASMMSSQSLKYYENLLKFARMAIHDASSFKVAEKNLAPSVRATIQLILSRLSADYIDSATPESLFETAFNQGWIGYKTLSTASIDHFVAYNNMGLRYVAADFYYAGTVDDKQVMRIAFSLENGVWKVDLEPIFVALDQTIRKFIEDKELDVELSLEETLKSSEAALEPEKWSPFISDTDRFKVNFPRTPVVYDENNSRVYSASHFKYGQFVVRVSQYLDNPDSPRYSKTNRDLAIKSFLQPLGSARPQCTQGMSGDDIHIRCEFDIPAKESHGLAVWIFSKEKQFLVFNLSAKMQFVLDAANTFVNSLGYID